MAILGRFSIFGFLSCEVDLWEIGGGQNRFLLIHFYSLSFECY